MPNSTRWKKITVDGGPEGIVVARKGGAQADWLCDLWLAERLADAASGAALDQLEAGDGGDPAKSGDADPQEAQEQGLATDHPAAGPGAGFRIGNWRHAGRLG